ncbi:MAG: serine/threonine protein kinase [Myxococcales bacterium]|nr:serine/threonine protein kinase [Myxococcales bacterium]
MGELAQTLKLRPAPPPLESDRFGRYRLRGELACGGMARIYLAAFEGPGGFVKPCVLKKVLPELCRRHDFTRMFENEARVAALLNHPNIVQAFDFGEVNGEYYLALEFVEGASLAGILRECRNQRIGPGLRVLVHVGISVCEALAYAHSARGPDGQPLNLVHRDVTPGNILVSATGAVKLTDFGIVRSSASVGHSRPDLLKGKLAYMSPEQACCQPLDGRSDVFSLGLVLYELATGQRPLARRTFGLSLEASQKGHVPPPSTVTPFPPELEGILMRALAPQAALRYPSAEAMRADLEAYRAQQHWTSGGKEASALILRLFPGGLPSSATALSRPTPGAPPPVEDPQPLAEIDVEMDSVPERTTSAARGREWILVLLTLLAATFAFWLFVS